MNGNGHYEWQKSHLTLSYLIHSHPTVPVEPSCICPHIALYVPEINSFFSDVQEHLLAPQLLVLRQEGETCLGLLHTLHIPVLE